MRHQGARLISGSQLSGTKTLPGGFILENYEDLNENRLSKRKKRELNQKEIDELIELGLVRVSTNNDIYITTDGEFVKENFVQEYENGRLLR